MPELFSEIDAIIHLLDNAVNKNFYRKFGNAKSLAIPAL